MSIIEDYVEAFKKYEIIDAPRPYFRSSILTLISAFAGRTFKFRYGPLMDIGIKENGTIGGGLILNIWSQNLGATRSARKTTVWGKMKDFIEAIADDLLISSSFTPEALVKDLDSKCEDGETNAIWLDDECGSFFRGIQKKDYMATAHDLLSTLYSGNSYTRSTITRGDEHILNPYIVTWLAGTDDVPRLFSEFQLRQGFLNRFLYIWGRRDEWFSPRAPPDKIRNVQEYIEGKIKPWLRALYAVSKSRQFVSINYDDNTWDLYDDFAKSVDNRSRDEDMGILSGWNGQMPNYVIKLSGLHRLARMSRDELSNMDAIVIAREEDYKWAKKYMDRRWEDFRYIIELMRTTSRSKAPRTDKRELNMVYRAIRRGIESSDDAWVKHSDVQTRTGLKKDTLLEDIDTLIDADEIKRKKYGQHTQGHPGVKYTLKKQGDEEEDVGHGVFL